MSLLTGVAGGKLLEKPKQQELPPTGDVDALKARIWKDLLPAQQEFVSDEEHRIIGYVGGFGSGKSFALCAKAIWLGLSNPNTTAMVAEPSFPMVRTVFIPAMDAALNQWEIDYDFRISPQPEYKLKLPNGVVTILCQSAENYQRVRGQNISFVLWDEADMLTQRKKQARCFLPVCGQGALISWLSPPHLKVSDIATARS